MERIKSTLSIVLLLCSGCVSAQLNHGQQWQSQLYVDHPLVGTIWDSRRDRFVEPSELFASVEGVNYLLLGEKHDNPDHHALQLQMLDYMLQTGRVSSVSFEMMSSEIGRAHV